MIKILQIIKIIHLFFKKKRKKSSYEKGLSIQRTITWKAYNLETLCYWGEGAFREDFWRKVIRIIRDHPHDRLQSFAIFSHEVLKYFVIFFPRDQLISRYFFGYRLTNFAIFPYYQLANFAGFSCDQLSIFRIFTGSLLTLLASCFLQDGWTNFAIFFPWPTKEFLNFFTLPNEEFFHAIVRTRFLTEKNVISVLKLKKIPKFQYISGTQSPLRIIVVVQGKSCPVDQIEMASSPRIWSKLTLSPTC